ncbi:multicopper oxidase domain-containing protein [Kangiella sp. M94]
MATYEIEIKTSQQPMDIGPPGAPLNANNLELYNGKVGLIIPNDFPTEIPGGVINVGDSLIVRLINDLPAPIATGIHWHGIELQSNADGTPVTQDPVPGGDLQVLGGIGGSPVGGTYLYKFKVTRPGVFWFHPHHFHSTNRVFKGTYGMLIVTDPNEAALIPGTIPDASNTEQLVLSDITVCGAPGNNPPYDPSLPWAGPGGVLPPQAGFSPEDICDIDAVDEEGAGIPAPGYGLGDVPNIQRPSGRVNEGITVLTNGVNVGPRGGTPTAPDPIVPADVRMIDVQPGQGLRLQIVNCATTRYFRLKLTTNLGVPIDLVRIGGEGGLLDNAVLEGGTINGFDTKYDEGEILLPPSSRADVVAAIPDDGTTDLTLWTLDFERLSGGGGTFANLPTVPVLHLNVTGAAVTPAYSMTGTANGQPDGMVIPTPLRSATGNLVDELGAATATLLDPATFTPSKDGMASQDIELTSGTPGINGIDSSFSGFTPYSAADHVDSSRYAKEGDLLELTVTNSTGAHHPFHLHGFSFQPKSITGPGGTFTWEYQEFRDTVDIPNGHTLTFKVLIEDERPFADDSVTHRGGSLGRWLFHCHIFFHAHRGMISELVITDKDGSGDEKPNIDVGGSWTYAPSGMIATRKGTYYLRDGDTLDTIVAHLDDGTPIGDITVTGGTSWEWQSHTPPNAALPDQINYVYVTITGNSGRKDQTVFRLQIGGADEGSDNGDPHIKTIDGTKYDFQSVGEFTLLADRDGMEIQTRQTPVLTATPITNSYTGLTSCVSVNTAVAALLGSHYISYQPGQDEGSLEFYVDGKRYDLTTRTLNLDNNLVRGVEIDGKMGLRVDFNNHAVLMATPHFWSSNNIHYLNISVSHTHGDEGLMGKIPEGNWLPKLRSGAKLGPKPRDLQQRYEQLYKTFADSWRVDDKRSLFTYAPGKSTADYTDKDWPTFQPPCKLKPQFEIPGATVLPAIPEEEAKIICQEVTEGDLFASCVADVSATGDKSFAEGYLIEQKIRSSATSVQVVYGNDKGKIRVTAIVLPLSKNGAKPTGKVTFSVNGIAVGQPVAVDSDGQATITLDDAKEGDQIEATYDGGDEGSLSSSNSPSLTISRLPMENINGGNKKWPWYFWLIMLLIILLLLALITF